MKRLLSILGITLALGVFACAQTLNEYLKLRRHYHITQAVGEEALETFVGTRVLEIEGVSKGKVRVAGNAPIILLEKEDGDTMCITCPSGAPEWLDGNEVPVRLIVRASRPTAKSDLTAELLGAATDGSIGRIEETEHPRVTSLGSRHGDREAVHDVSPNSAVPIYANFIRGRNPRLTTSEATRIADGVIGYSIKYGVDARLIMAMVMVESGFNPHATSRTGAMGLGQLMPGTAVGMGVSNAYDSIDNLYGTVRLIRGHLDNYERQTGNDYQSLVLALAAYNAGAGAVSRHGGVPPYRETQNYVRKVIGIYRALCGV